MIRKIIHIEEEKCTGCGLCADACHEGAIVMENGKAKLIRDDYCDGLGDCLPVCPADAIRMTEREAVPYDEEAIRLHIESQRQKTESQSPSSAGCCEDFREKIPERKISGGKTERQETLQGAESMLTNWPVQIRLAPVSAAYFKGADLLIAADCAAYSCGNFHRDFVAGRVVLVGCPKLDPVDYAEKLAEIFSRNEINSITLTRMEVPCCGGMEAAVHRALDAGGVNIPFETVILSIEGEILERRKG